MLTTEAVDQLRSFLDAQIRRADAAVMYAQDNDWHPKAETFCGERRGLQMALSHMNALDIPEPAEVTA